MVYVSIGGVALLAALGLSPHAEGALGALDAWGNWPPGVLLLWFTALGLCGFAGWRALQSVFDADRQGTKPKALFARAGQAVSGLVYGALALSSLELLDAIEDLHETDDQARTREAVGQILDWPGGELVVIAAGLFVLGAGIGSMVRGVFEDFCKSLRCDPATARWAQPMARVGYFGRGLAFLPAGAFTTSAGLHARAGEAQGLGGALDMLKAQPLGHLTLGLVALGVVAFGAFAFVEAWLRPIRPERALES